MKTLLLLLVLHASSAQTNEGKTSTEATQNKAEDAPQADAKNADANKAAEKKEEDCDESSALAKKLGVDKQAAEKDKKEAADKAVNGLANLGVIPAEKVEEKKPDPIIPVQKMENCQ